MNQDVRARIVRIVDALEDGEYRLALDIARDLENDYPPVDDRARCPDCDLPFDAPGLVIRHLSIVHGRAA